MQCETGSREIRFIKNNDTNENIISVIRCCHRTDEPIYQWTADDILSMTKQEFMKKIFDGYNIIPDNHDYNTYFYCKTKEKQCIWNDEYLDTISVATSVLCNIKCKMCDIISHKKVFPIDKVVYFDILNKIKGYKLKTIELTSEGEPFIYKEDTIKYIESLTLNDCKELEIMSNLTLLTEEDIIRIYTAVAASGIKVKFLCSCSGITEETYKEIHKNDKFNQVVKNIQLICRLNMLNCINFVVMPDNLHELEFFKQFWLDHNVPEYYCSDTLIVDYNYPGATKYVQESLEYRKYKGLI